MCDKKKTKKQFLNHVKSGRTDEVKRMIRDGEIDVHCNWLIGSYSKKRYTAIYFAVKHGRFDLVKYLHSLGLKTTELTNGVISSLAHHERYEIIEYLIKTGWSKDKVDEIVCYTLYGDKQIEKLARYANHFNIDPIKVLKEYWTNQLPRVTYHYQAELNKKIKSLDKYKRDISIIRLTETS